MRIPSIVLRLAVAGALSAAGLLTALPGAQAAISAPSPHVCNAGWEYNPVYVTEAHVGKGPVFKDHNGSGHKAPVTFTSTTTGTPSPSTSTSTPGGFPTHIGGGGNSTEAATDVKAGMAVGGILFALLPGSLLWTTVSRRRRRRGADATR